MTPVTDSFLIKAKVTFKAIKKTYQNYNGQGCVFGIEILDKDGSEIKCTLFNDIAEKFYPILQTGSTYEFSGGRVKVANKRYQRCDNDFSLYFDYSTEIRKLEDDGLIGDAKLNVTLIKALKDLPEYSKIDVLAIVAQADETETV